MSNSKLNSSVMILCWWLPKPARGRCALNSPPHPLPRERPLARSLGRETQRLQSHPEGPCVVTVCCWIILEKHSSICQTYLSNWSPFRGEIPRSDGLIWLKNWLRLIPGTRFGHFSKIFNIPDRSQSALLSAVNKCLLIFSISPKLHICSTHESYKNVESCKVFDQNNWSRSQILNQIIWSKSQILNLTKISLALALLTAEQAANLGCIGSFLSLYPIIGLYQIIGLYLHSYINL